MGTCDGQIAVEDYRKRVSPAPASAEQDGSFNQWDGRRTVHLDEAFGQAEYEFGVKEQEWKMRTDEVQQLKSCRLCAPAPLLP
jgi:hypothetical protein